MFDYIYGASKRIPNHVGTGTIRPANRNQKGKEGIHRFPQEIDYRWFYHVSVFDIPAALFQS